MGDAVHLNVRLGSISSHAVAASCFSTYRTTGLHRAFQVKATCEPAPPQAISRAPFPLRDLPSLPASPLPAPIPTPLAPTTPRSAASDGSPPATASNSGHSSQPPASLHQRLSQACRRQFFNPIRQHQPPPRISQASRPPCRLSRSHSSKPPIPLPYRCSSVFIGGQLF